MKLLFEFTSAVRRKLTALRKLLSFVRRLSTYGMAVGYFKIISTEECELQMRRTRAFHIGSRQLLTDFKFDVEVEGLINIEDATRNYLIVSNHLSYMDPIVIASCVPTQFVTSVDMGESVFLGDLCRLGGCLFIERRNRSRVERDLSQISGALKARRNVTLFPEGTSSNGQTVLPFKKSLLMAAVEANVDILPIAISYVKIDHRPVNDLNRDQICWYGDMSFAPHFIDLLSVSAVKVKIQFLNPIKVSAESSRDELAAAAYKQIHAAFRQTQTHRVEGDYHAQSPDLQFVGP